MNAHSTAPTNDTLDADLVISNAVEHYWNEEHTSRPMLLLETEQRDMGRFVLDALPEFDWTVVRCGSVPTPEVRDAIHHLLVFADDHDWNGHTNDAQQIVESYLKEFPE